MKQIADRAFGALAPYLGEARKLSVIAAPLVLSSLVSMGVSVVDLVMMAWLGPQSLAAGAVVSDYYSVFFYLFVGLIASTTAIIARAIGAGDHREVRNTVHGGVLIALLAGLIGLLIMWNTDIGLRLIGIDASMIAIGLPYAQIMGLTFIALLGVNLLHYFLSAHGETRVIFYASLLALPLNALGNYALMFGNLGLPALGLAGAAWSSFVATSFMFVFLACALWARRCTADYDLLSRPRLQWSSIREILRVGMPIGISNLGEMGVFLLATVIMGRFGPEAVAAHIIALRMAGVVYAVPLGFAQAATVRIGLAIGARQSENLRIVFMTSLTIAAGVGVLFFSLIALFRADLSILFLATDQATAEMVMQASLFLLLLAVAQPMDCIGAVGNGILRGFKDTRVPMVFSLLAFWGVGFAGGLVMAFEYELAGTGLWLGLAGSSIAFGLLVIGRLLWRWREVLPADLPLVNATA